MVSYPKTRTVSDIVLRNWTVLLCFEMLYQVVGNSLLFPFLQDALSLLPEMLGERYLSQENLLLLPRHPLAILLLAGVCLLAGLFIYFELITLILYSEQGWRQKRITVWGLCRDALGKTLGLLHPARIPAVLFLPVMLLSSFAMASGYLRTVQVPEFILEYLESDPPLFFLFAAAVLLFHLLFFCYLFGLPALLLNGMSFRASWRESLRLLRRRKWRTAGFLLICVIVIAAVLFVMESAAVYLLAGCVRLFYGPKAGRTQFQMYFYSLEGAWRLVSGALLSAFLCAVLVALYHGYRGDTRPGAVKAPMTLKRLTGLITVILCTLSVVVLFGESEAGGRVWFPDELSTNIVAHRAGAAFAPENTVAALEQAIEDHADIAEVDVQQLKDGTLIVMHDANFKRTTGMDLPVWDANYEQVKRLDAGSFFSYDFVGEPIPTLDNMLTAAKGRIRLMIELKPTGHEHDMVEGVLALINTHGMREQCVIASMSLDLLKRVKELDSRIQTVYISALLLSQRYDLEYLDAYSVETTSLTRELVVMAHLQGKQVYAWTANSENTIQKILRCQANGVVTDYVMLANYSLIAARRNIVLESISDVFFPEASSREYLAGNEDQQIEGNQP